MLEIDLEQEFILLLTHHSDLPFTLLEIPTVSPYMPKA
jgi:hypothetical protein